jgi:uncharacterized membrane protein
MTHHEGSTLIAARYASEEAAQTILRTLERMQSDAAITLLGAAVVTREDGDRASIDEAGDLTAGKAAAGGAAIGGLIGLLFPPSIVLTAAIGAAVGGALGAVTDQGIANDELETFANDLRPGQAAVVALVDNASVVSVQSALEGYDGELLVQGVDENVIKSRFEAEAANQTPTEDPPAVD